MNFFLMQQNILIERGRHWNEINENFVAFGLAMTMTVSMSAVSYAQIPLSMMIASTAPITMQKMLISFVWIKRL